MSNFDNTRIAEMLDCHASRELSLENRQEGNIVLIAATLGALQTSMAFALGPHLLNPRFNLMREAFDKSEKLIILTLLEYSGDKVKEHLNLYKATREALLKDVEDLRHGD